MSISEGNYDAPSNPTTWARLSGYGKVDGWIAAGSDQDWYRVYLQGGRTYTITMEDRIDPNHGGGYPFDSKLTLFDATGKRIASGSEDGTNLPDDSQIVFTPSSTGIFFVQAAGASAASGSGTYTLQLLSNGSSSDIPETEATTQKLVTGGGPLTGELEIPTDADLIRLDLQAGLSYALRSRGTNVEGLQLLLYDPSKNYIGPLATDGVFQPLNSGTHFLAVSSTNPWATGHYTLELTRPAALITIEGTNTLTQSVANEGDGKIVFNVKLNRPTSSAVSVELHSLAVGTATPGLDFSELHSTIAFAPGETTKQVTVQVVNDNDRESAEAFVLELRNPVGGAINQAKGFGYIFDDELKYGGSLLTNFDPLSVYQWYLYPEIGINASSAWELSTGKGVKVAVLDQGIDSSHSELSGNVLISDGRIAATLKPGGDPIYPGDNHGTAVAGVIAAVKNGSGIVGAAFDADLVSIYQSFGNMPGENSLVASLNGLDYAVNFDVLNDSWGYAPQSIWQTLQNPWAMYDNFRSLQFFAHGEAVKKLAENGRAGFGTVIVQSAGNSFDLGDDTNLHNFQNSRYIITVAATDFNGDVTSYSSPGASILVAAPGGGGEGWLNDIYTTDRTGANGYSTGDLTYINGTSFSAPLVSAVVALMLERNPMLGYRDVQTILAYSARQTSENKNTWATNGAKDWNGGGLHFDAVTHDLGFGLVDANVAVKLAETWKNPPATSANDIELTTTQYQPTAIPDGNNIGVTKTIYETRPLTVERVEVTVNILHTYIGDLALLLTSPEGTESWLLHRPGSNELLPFGQDQDQIDFTFTTTLSMGETSVGNWSLKILDLATQDSGEFQSWTLNLIGRPATSDDVYVYTDEYAMMSANEPSRVLLRDIEGVDTVNMAAVSTEIDLDLQPGSTSYIRGAPLRIAIDTYIENALGGDASDRLIGNHLANRISGRGGNDTINGADGNDILIGGSGNDVIIGGAGLDIAVYDELRSKYDLRASSGSVVVAGNESGNLSDSDTLTTVERIHFKDLGVAFDLDGNAGAVAKAIGALYGPKALKDPDVVARHLRDLDSGLQYQTLIADIVESAAFRTLAGSSSNSDFVKLVYKNVVGIDPSEFEFNYYVNLLNSGAYTQASLALLACETDVNKIRVDLIGLSVSGLSFDL